MTLATKPIDATQLTFRYSGCAEHFSWENGKRAEAQTRDPDTGFPVWKVKANVTFAEAEEHGVVTVTVASKDNPAETATFDGEIAFEGITERTWVNSDNANSGQTWTARAINTRPGGRAAAAPPAPPVRHCEEGCLSGMNDWGGFGRLVASLGGGRRTG